MNRKKFLDFILCFCTWSAALVTGSILLLLIGYMIIKGLPNVRWSLLAWHYTSENVSVLPAIINTFLMAFISLSISIPLGISTAVYLVEYAKRGSRIVEIVRITTETLSGIPSIIYGLFGLLFFVKFLSLKTSLLSGAFTLSIMILPLIIRTTEEALMSVPDAYREGSFGLGAGRLRTVWKIVIPAASSGILAGVILAFGRIVGETAALVYTSGTSPQVPQHLQDSARTIALHMYILSGEGLHRNEAYATALILLIIIMAINIVAEYAARKFTAR